MEKTNLFTSRESNRTTNEKTQKSENKTFIFFIDKQQQTLQVKTYAKEETQQQ